MIFQFALLLVLEIEMPNLYVQHEIFRFSRVEQTLVNERAFSVFTTSLGLTVSNLVTLGSKVKDYRIESTSHTEKRKRTFITLVGVAVFTWVVANSQSLICLLHFLVVNPI